MDNTSEVKIPLSEYLEMRETLNQYKETLLKIQNDTAPVIVRYDRYSAWGYIVVFNPTDEIKKVYAKVDFLEKEAEALKEKKVPIFNWKAKKVKDL